MYNFVRIDKGEIENIINAEDENVLNFMEDTIYFEETGTPNNWKKWLEIIENELAEEYREESEKPNAYRNIHFAKIIKKDILLLPLWTKLLETKIGYGSGGGSTASCESEINKIKNIILKDIKNKTIRVDSFVERHINHLFGEMLLVNANSEIHDYEIDKSSLYESQELQEKENWRGKIIKKSKIADINSVGSCSIFVEDNKENIKPEKSETDKPQIPKFPENKKNQQAVLKNLANKPRKLPLYLGTRKNILIKNYNIGNLLKSVY